MSVTHQHGMSDAHTHTDEDYRAHQQPIDGEVFVSHPVPLDYAGHTSADAVPVAERVDEKGRTHVALLTERELLEETVTRLRNVGDAIELFGEHMASNPMMKNLLGL